MAFIRQDIKDEIDAADVRVFFVSGRVTKWYNARRSDKRTQVPLLGGWYWIAKREEYGPFRTPSAAMRDAYYRVACNVAPPLLSENDVADAKRAMDAPAAPPPRPRRPARAMSAAL